MSDVTEKKRPSIALDDDSTGGWVNYYKQSEADALFETLESERDAARVACALSCTLHACDSPECAAHVLLEDGKKIVEERDALKAELERFHSTAIASANLWKAEVEKAESDLARLKTHMDAATEVERGMCMKALRALAGAHICTPAETYGTNSSWALSDLCRAVTTLSADLAREKALAKVEMDRALARIDGLEQEVKRATESEAREKTRIVELAKLFGVCDGGRYLNDWITHADRYKALQADLDKEKERSARLRELVAEMLAEAVGLLQIEKAKGGPYTFKSIDAFIDKAKAFSEDR